MAFSSQQQIQVLHVEDDPDFADLTATFLERDDDRFTVETATSADQGIDAINDTLPDCIISDYDMPGMDGIEFLQAVREQHPDLPFILFTGKGSEAVASDAIAADVTDYLQKGAGSEKYELLANRIRNAVQSRRETQRADRQEELMRLTEFAGDTGGFELDRGSGTILLTAGARRMIGRPEQSEISLEEAIELFHPDDREHIRQTLDEAFTTGEELHDTWRLHRDDGDERLLDVTITPVTENGEVTKLRGAGHDITDREERQRELEQTETLFQHAQDSLFLIDVGDEYSVKRVNPAWVDRTGLSAERVRGQTPRDILGERPGSAAEARYDECIQRQEPLQYEETIRFDGGITHWVTRIAPVMVDGTVEYIAGSTRDVTEQKERQQGLEQYETVVEALTDAVYVIDEEGRFTYVNDEFVELVGYDRETILGSTASLIKGEEAVEQAERQLGRLLSSDGPETLAFEVMIHPREGEPIVCEDHMGALPYDGEAFDGSVGILRDITDQKQRQRELERTHDLMRNMEALADVGAWEYDPETDTLAMTDGARQIHGLAPEAELTLTDVLEHFHPEDRELLTTRLTDCLETGETHEIDVRLSSAGNTQRWVTVRGERVADRDGIVVRGYIQDITESREYEQKLEAQNERLEEFASIVSHDLRNPLNTATGYLDLLASDHTDERIDKIDNALNRATSLITDLLTLARQGKAVDETTETSLTGTGRRAWESVRSAEATLTMESDLGYADIDESRLRQAFENLFRNAVEHSDTEVRIRMGLLEDADGLYIEDTGPGIASDQRERVFEHTYSTSEDGTGLGLSIVKRIVEAHGWEIQVVEGCDGGARFEITGVEFTDC